MQADIRIFSFLGITSSFGDNLQIKSKKERGTYMKTKWALLAVLSTIAAVLTGCESIAGSRS